MKSDCSVIGTLGKDYRSKTHNTFYFSGRKQTRNLMYRVRALIKSLSSSARRPSLGVVHWSKVFDF